MRILERLKKMGQKEPEIRQFCLQTIRFKQFLQNARALFALFDDGREKSLGEYIFDRHYVTTLIDAVVERLGMMVYDACVLAPASGEALYASYDAHKLRARRLLTLDPSGRNTKAPETTASTDPEYQLLFDALNWFNGKEAIQDPTVMAFMEQIFFKVIQSMDSGLAEIQGVESMAAMERLTGLKARPGRAGDLGIYLVDLWKDGAVEPKQARPTRYGISLPLTYLLKDAKAGETLKTEDKTHNPPEWIAGVSEHQLSLNRMKPDFKFRLESFACGEAKSDFIFIFADKSMGLDNLLSPGFHVERTDYGQFAWRLNISTDALEEELMVIGHTLFK